MRNESDLAEGEKKNACRPIGIIRAKKEIHENRVVRQKTQERGSSETFYFLKKPPS